jgi:hypothetical protein
MQSFKVLRLTVLAVLAATGCGLSQSTTPHKEKAPPNEIRMALMNGPVVLVVQPSGKADTSEAYGDWAEYLNAFAAREKSVKIVKLSGRRYSELVTSPQLNKPLVLTGAASVRTWEWRFVASVLHRHRDAALLRPLGWIHLLVAGCHERHRPSRNDSGRRRARYLVYRFHSRHLNRRRSIFANADAHRHIPRASRFGVAAEKRLRQ